MFGYKSCPLCAIYATRVSGMAGIARAEAAGRGAHRIESGQRREMRVSPSRARAATQAPARQCAESTPGRIVPQKSQGISGQPQIIRMRGFGAALLAGLDTRAACLLSLSSDRSLTASEREPRAMAMDARPLAGTCSVPRRAD